MRENLSTQIYQQRLGAQNFSCAKISTFTVVTFEKSAYERSCFFNILFVTLRFHVQDFFCFYTEDAGLEITVDLAVALRK